MSRVAAFRPAGLRAHHLTMNHVSVERGDVRECYESDPENKWHLQGWLSWQCLIDMEKLAHIQFRSRTPAPIVVWLWL